MSSFLLQAKCSVKYMTFHLMHYDKRSRSLQSIAVNYHKSTKNRTPLCLNQRYYCIGPEIQRILNVFVLHIQ